MKTIKKLMMLLVAVFSLMTFSACDSDTTTRWELEGVWTGKFAMYLNVGYHSYKADNTTLYFDSDRKGTQVDQYPGGYVDYNYFRWDVRGGNIIMDYYDDNNGLMAGQHVTIYSYTLYDDHWEGTVQGQPFTMNKAYDYYAKQRNNTSLQSAEEE